LHCAVTPQTPLNALPQEGETASQARQCPQCDEGVLSIKLSKGGGFIGCSNYPDCGYSRGLKVGEPTEDEAAMEGQSGVRLLGFHMGTWGCFPGGGQTENLYTSEKQKTNRGCPFQSAYRGWSVPTKNCGYFEVNLSLSVGRPGSLSHPTSGGLLQKCR